MTADPFIDSLTNKTSPVPYDQVIVLSQKIINDSFYNMWVLADDTSPIRSINLKTRDGQTLTGKLKAPTIIVNVVDYTYMLYFQWNFNSGSMTLYTTDNPNDPTTKTFDLTNWVVAFGTTMTRETIPPSDPNYASYVKQMAAQGTFSLAKLYIDAQETPGYYAPGSSFNGEDWSKESAVIQANFEELRMVWMEAMKNAGQTHVGVMLSTNDPASVNPNAPTFPPATIDHAVYPWKDPTNPTPPMNEVDSNALCYMIMTGNDQPPVPPQLPYSGTWVDADKSEPYRSAIFCMNSTQYWSSWFLPLVQVINLATQIQAEPPYFVPQAPETCLVGLSFTPATCTAHPDYTDKYYAFQPVSPNPDNNAWTWTANSDLLATNNSIQSGGNNFSLAQYGTASSKLTFDQGGQTITITGSNSAGMRFSGTGDWGDVYSTMSFTMQFTLKYAITRVDDGGLQILAIAAPESTASPVSIDNGPLTWSPPLEQYGPMLQNQSFANFQRNLGLYNTAFLNGLAGQHKLFLPGAGDYLCNNVMFSKRGDLLTNLVFNGAAPPGETRPIPPFLVDAPPRQYPTEDNISYQAPQTVQSYISRPAANLSHHRKPHHAKGQVS